MLIAQYLLSRMTKPQHRAFLERACLDGLSLFNILGLIGLSMAGIGSAYLFALGAASLILTITINDMALIGFSKIENKEVAGHHRVHPLTYLVLSAMPASVGSEGEEEGREERQGRACSPLV
jgi:hypothetical protein